MFESISCSHRIRRLSGPCLLAALSVANGLAPPAAAQTSPPKEQEAEEVIEWNFRRVPVPSEEISLQERWAAPFAVQSSGRPAPRPPRQVVMVRDTAAARMAAAAQSAAGQSASEVTVGADAAVSSSTGSVGAATGGPPVRAPVEAAESASSGAASEAGERPRAAGSASPPAGSATSPSRTHRVAYGETWYGIANEYGVPSRDLAAANPEVDPERLRSGTVLRIPRVGQAAQRPRTHTVSRGDTLFGIARRYGVSVTALRSANRITDDVVRLGQTLVIPREEGSR
jgi:LysM repeat protein